MQSTARQILDALGEPEALEALYRRDPAAFRDALGEAAREAPDSMALRIWRARIEYRDTADWARDPRLWQAIVVGLACGLLVRLPALWLGEEWYYPRMAPSLVILSLAAYFWLGHRDRGRTALGAALAVVAAIYTALLPASLGAGGLEYPDSVTMALLHLPVLLWVFLGLVFTATDWRLTPARIRFLRYNGELLILGSLVGLGGMVFSGLTVALFALIFDNPEEWYFANVGVLGAAGVPVAATYLYDVVFRRRTGIASALAQVFAPLFLVMAVSYLIAAFLSGQNPFIDRSFLIVLNGLLLVVLGMTVLSVAEREGRAEITWSDTVSVALVTLTLLIDLIALSAILFRIGSYGFTPNRVVVLGANLVIMGHLARTWWAYAGFVRSRCDAAAVQRAVVGYLPVYAGWAAIVVFLLPLLFRFA